MKLSDFSKWSGGHLNAASDSEIESVITDSRRAVAGSLFICIKGKRRDGHDFIEQVKKSGGYTLGEKENCDIVVKSSVDALARAAGYYRSAASMAVIGVTGSSGKTTTVGMVASILKNKDKTCSTPKSFNTLIGVSEAILNFSPACRYGVIEMGANHQGEIRQICSVARPSAGIITNIGDAHIGCFGSRENLLNAKFELAESLPSEGCLIYNYDQEDLRKKASLYSDSKISFGFKDGSDVRGKIVDISYSGSIFEWKGIRIGIKIPGSFNVLNALAAIAGAIHFKASDEEIKRGLEEYSPPEHRMSYINIEGIEIVDDCYNANPASVKALFLEMLKIHPQKDIIAVTGCMHELGDRSEDLHRETGSFLAGIDNVKYILSSGKYSSNLLKGAEESGFKKKNLFSFSGTCEASEIIKKIAGKKSLVVLKASRLESFEKILEELKQ